MRAEDAQRQVLDRELFGMRFGLDRMRRMMTALGHPERRFRQVHVVGTNGKSSTTRMTAALLSGHGLRTGSYLSPHLVDFAERIRVGDSDITGDEFAGAVERALAAAGRVDRSAGGDDQVTQFELLTAAAYSELARQQVDVAVIEAGLGGRYDATNVIDSEVQVLTSVGLEHTRWLGPTVEAIAREKLDVVRPGGTLVLGPELHPDARAVADEVAAQRGARIVVADGDAGELAAGLTGYQRRNFAVAIAAARAFLGAVDDSVVRAVAASVRVPGRLQIVADRPLTMLDGAHNPDGIAALAGSLPDLAADRASGIGVADAGTGGLRVAVVSILDDKDAAAMLVQLAPRVDRIVFTSSENPRALPPPTLGSLLEQIGGPPHEIVRDPRQALARGRELAGPAGFVVATGSIYLVAELTRPASAAGDRRVSRL